VKPIPNLAFWLQLLVLLAAGTAVVTLLAALAAGRVSSGTGRRSVWRAALLALLVLFGVEITGTAGALTDWLHSESRAHEPAQEPTITQASESAARPPGHDEQSDPEPPQDVPEARPESGADEGAVWWPGLVWLVGATLVAGRAVLARLLLLVFRWKRRAVVDPDLQKRVRSVAERLGLRRRVRILESESLRGPVAFGIVWPTIALPARFADEHTHAQQEAMLAHELGHLAAHDPAWHLFADLLAALQWWHPLAWWLRRQLATASEAAADEASLVVADGPSLLAACLVELGGRLADRRAGAWLPMAGGFRSALGRRVQRLLGLGGQAWRPPGRLVLALVLILGPPALVAVAVLSTAWARSRVFAEGVMPMQTGKQTWPRSLAALVLVAALGSADDRPAVAQPTAPGGEQPPAKRIDKEVPPQEGGRDAGNPDDPKVRELTEQLREAEATLAAALDRLNAKRKVREELRRVEADPATQTKKVEKEIQDLEVQLKQLAADREVLVGRLLQLKEKREESKKPHLKVFRLNFRDPGEVRDVLEKLLPWGEEEAGPGRSRMPMGGGGMGFRPPWHLAVDGRTRCLIVRGSARDLQLAADLVALLDVPADKPLPRVKNFRAFRLQHAKPEAVAKILENLDINATLAPAPQARILVVAGSEATLKEVAEVLDAVDVEVPEKKPEIPEKKP
jgi:hypothetical protein